MEQPIVNPAFAFWLNALGSLIPHKLCESVLPISEMLLPEIKTHLDLLTFEFLLINKGLDQMSSLKNWDFLFHYQSLLWGFFFWQWGLEQENRK